MPRNESVFGPDFPPIFPITTVSTNSLILMYYFHVLGSMRTCIIYYILELPCANRFFRPSARLWSNLGRLNDGRLLRSTRTEVDDSKRPSVVPQVGVGLGAQISAKNSWGGSGTTDKARQAIPF